MSVFNAFSPVVHFGALQTIGAELDREILAIMAEPYALGRLLGGTELQGYSGIFIDVGGGTTDISLVVDGSVVSTKMFTIGGKAFTKRLAYTLNISIDEAEEVKIAFSNGQLEQQSHKIVSRAIESDIEVWTSGVFLTLREMTEVDSLPPTIYLSGGGSMLNEIKVSLEQSEWHKN